MTWQTHWIESLQDSFRGISKTTRESFKHSSHTTFWSKKNSKRLLFEFTIWIFHPVLWWNAILKTIEKLIFLTFSQKTTFSDYRPISKSSVITTKKNKFWNIYYESKFNSNYWTTWWQDFPFEWNLRIFCLETHSETVDLISENGNSMTQNWENKNKNERNILSKFIRQDWNPMLKWGSRRRGSEWPSLLQPGSQKVRSSQSGLIFQNQKKTWIDIWTEIKFKGKKGCFKLVFR